MSFGDWTAATECFLIRRHEEVRQRVGRRYSTGTAGYSIEQSGGQQQLCTHKRRASCKSDVDAIQQERVALANHIGPAARRECQLQASIAHNSGRGARCFGRAARALACLFCPIPEKVCASEAMWGGAHASGWWKVASSSSAELRVHLCGGGIGSRQGRVCHEYRRRQYTQRL